MVNQVISKIVGAVLLLASVQAQAMQVKNPMTGEIYDTQKVSKILQPIGKRAEEVYRKSVESTLFMPGERIVLIDSPGGDVAEGNKIVALMELEKALGTKMVCVVLRDAHSMAFNILTHCNVRLMVKGSTSVVHKCATNVFYFGTVRAKELKELARALDKADAPFRRDNAKAMHLSLRRYDYYADKETRWSAERLKKIKYLDGIMPEAPILD